MICPPEKNLPEPPWADEAPPAYSAISGASTSRTSIPPLPQRPVFHEGDRVVPSSSTSIADSQTPPSIHPTVVFAIPFPDALTPTEKDQDKIPPFVLYAPLAAPLKKPEEGEKEGRAHKARRKWQEGEREAREKGGGFKAKTVKLISKGMSATKNSRVEFLVRTPNKKALRELHIIFPSSYHAKDIKERFTDLLKQTKSGAIRNGIISTAMLPFVLTFDVLTFITGPFEINAVWAASSWTSAVRASTISSRVASQKLPVHLTPDERLDVVAHRLHEICWRKARPHTVHVPRWTGAGPIRRGPDLGGTILDVLRHCGQDMAEIETDRWLVAEDLERCLKKGAREWVEMVSS